MQNGATYHDEIILIRDFKSGDIRAFRTIYVLFQRQLLYFSNEILKDQEKAEDFVSEKFFIVWEKRVEFDSLKAISNFLYVAIRNRCYTYLSQLKSREASHRELALLSDKADNSFLMQQIHAELLHYSFLESENLPSEMKKVFDLLFVEGVSTKDAAEKLGVSEVAIRSQKSKAISRLRVALEKKGILQIIVLLSWVFQFTSF